MPSLKEVKGRINSVKSTQQITKAMKMVAAAKLRRAQDRIIKMRPYAEKLNGILRNVSGTVDAAGSSSNYSEVRPVNNVLIVVVTSDRGLCGGFNSNAIKAASSLIRNEYAAQQDAGAVTFLCIGKKGYEFFSKRGMKVIGDFYTLFSDLSFDNVKRAAEYAMNGFLEKKYDVVEIVYNEFKNVATQIVRRLPLLPVLPPEKNENEVATEYIYEPTKEEILTDLIPKSIKIQFYKTVLDSNAAENGARMSAMDKATDNAAELLKQLILAYNRTRQAAITKEILEIVAGAEALRGK